MKIITITPSPAIDLHLRAEGLIVGEYNTAKVIRRDMAGKGVNLSRALTTSGIDNLAVVFPGREDEAAFLAPLDAIGMRTLSVGVEGRVRQNINIHLADGETVISTDGAPITAEHIARAEAEMLTEIDEETYIVLSGSISTTSDKEAMLAMLYRMKARGVRLILDSRSLTLEEIIALRPYLIKPNEAEAEALTGMPCDSIATAVITATAIRDMGCERVLLTLGGKGAVLATPTGVYTTTSPKVEVLSTVGAGDSTIAGYLASRALGEDDYASLCRAVAFGSAACTEEGTSPPRPEVIERLLASMHPVGA